MAFGLKMPKMMGGSSIRPVSVSTGGIHPLVKKSMLPRLKMNRASGVVAQSNMMRGMARSQSMRPSNGGGNLMSRVELKSRRAEVGRQPRA
jgi:hypothetical protein